MILSYTLLGLVAYASFSAAWMPDVHKQILSSNGRDLFNTTIASTSSDKRWLPSTSSGKIRGVNLGSMFVFEPWMAQKEWKRMGCGGYSSEFDCVSGLGQTAANKAFQDHWSSWITDADIAEMVSYGLNTIRIPVGYWMKEDLVYSDSEHFPQGGFTHLEELCGLAASHGMYVIIDLHGAPGAQVASNADTGQIASSPGFYQESQYDRALNFLVWLTNNIHNNTNFRTVGTLEIVNEPVRNSKTVATMLSSYYPKAVQQIRAAESALGISSGNNNQLNIMMMSTSWGSGNPTSHLPSNSTSSGLAFDDHRYLKYVTTIPTTQSAYISASCADNRGPASSTNPIIVGEFSLSVASSVEKTTSWLPANAPDFYRNWWLAQQAAYEKSNGWVFWAWKAQLSDLRWSYRDAVKAGVIPTDLDSVTDSTVCS